ncbi:MAG: PEP-CTERM sorting domain-containing protein [Phycisphaerales bacterium]|nr:PEP-CTERM sorting domain-containing protein [Phycisphaerales bacterium]
MFKANVLFVAVSSLLAGASMAQAAVIMDATTNNGSLSINSSNGLAPNNGGWGNAVSKPLGWEITGGSGYTQNEAMQNYYGWEAYNNTGTLVTANTQYSVSAAVNTYANKSVGVKVLATEHADGTGASVLLADAQLNPGTASTTWPTYNSLPPLTTVSNTGAATSPALSTYYVQVRTYGDLDAFGYYWVDDIVVTSAPVPEPASMLTLLGLGSLSMLKRRRL